jgi:hypothetical protein
MIEWLIREHANLIPGDAPALHLDEHGEPWLYLNAEGLPFDPFTARYVIPRRNTVAAIREARIRLQARLRRDYHRRLIAWYREERAAGRQP